MGLGRSLTGLEPRRPRRGSVLKLAARPWVNDFSFASSSVDHLYPVSSVISWNQEFSEFS